MITGGAGFIGSHVVDAVLMEFPKAKVVVLDIFDYMASDKNLSDARKIGGDRLVVEEGDFCNAGVVRLLLKQHEIDTIMHLGAMTHVDASFGNSLKFTHVNVQGTHTLLECAKEYGKIRRFIHCSTDETYGEAKQIDERNPNPPPFGEEQRFDPTNPYAASKAAAEMQVKAYWHSWRLPVIITRGNNTYGPRQFPEKVIPRFLALIRKKKPLTIHGSGQQLRSFLHVHDVAQAFVTILKKGHIGEAYNIGTKFELSIGDLARDLLERTGSQVHLTFTHDRNFNDQRYYISARKLRKLGWKPKISWDEGILQTIRWYNNTDLAAHWPQLAMAFTPETGYFE